MRKPPNSLFAGLMYAAINGWILEKYDESRFQDFKQTLPRDLIGIFDNLDIKQWYPAEDVYHAYEYFIKFFENQMSQSELIASIVDFMFRQSITGFMKGTNGLPHTIYFDQTCHHVLETGTFCRRD